MTGDSVLVLFPGALGDFVCFLPTLFALRQRHTGPMLVVAQPTLLELVNLPHSTTAAIHRREVADLFALGPLAAATRRLFGGCAWTYSWTGFDDANVSTRLAAATGGTVHVYQFRGMQPGEHAIDYYARCAGTRAAHPVTVVTDTEWVKDFVGRNGLSDRKLLLIHAGSGAPAKNWQGAAALVRYWGAHYDDAIVLLRGPAETESNWSHPGVISVSGLSLPQVAALLQRSDVYLGNDSGISHLAAAVGARGVVLFGPSAPAVWAPRGGTLQVLHAPTPCTRCGPDLFCVHRLSVERATEALNLCRQLAEQMT